MSSELYYFHTFDQMLLTAQMCPDIEDMLFMFQVNVIISVLKYPNVSLGVYV